MYSMHGSLRESFGRKLSPIGLCDELQFREQDLLIVFELDDAGVAEFG